MKPRFGPAAFCTTLFFAATACLSSCATTGMDRAAKSSDSMGSVEADYRQAAVQIDATKAALAALVKPEQANLKKAYASYADNVAAMEKLGKRLNLHTEKMSARGNEYFSQWESSYTNPEIRELSERRRIEMREVYAQIPEASIGARGALKSYLTDIGEIRRYLANDLTPRGIGAIGPVARRAANDGDGLKETIEHVLIAIDKAKAGMAEGGTPQHRSE